MIFADLCNNFFPPVQSDQSGAAITSENIAGSNIQAIITPIMSPSNVSDSKPSQPEEATVGKISSGFGPSFP